MRVRTTAIVAACGAAVLAVTAVAWPASATNAIPSAEALAIARQTLPANDGWASAGTGTTGGSAAAPAQTFLARNRAELITALGGDNSKNGANATPKIIFVEGTIDANTDDAGKELSCDSYRAPGFDFAKYLELWNPELDPAPWGQKLKPKDAIKQTPLSEAAKLENARLASVKNQGAHIKINVGSNTTIIGVGSPKITGANLILNNVSNVIIRNVGFEDAFDCFPGWDPGDGVPAVNGNWNSEYDTISLTGATNVWVDHNSFSDGDNDDADQPLHFGRPLQVHDGLLDITKKSDLVTVSYNHFHDHDKTMLIGSSDPSTSTPVTGDEGKLRVTLHHNFFANVGQRVPRVRFGQVDIYNNYYQVTNDDARGGFDYAWGVGVAATIYAERNFFRRSTTIKPERFIRDWRKAGFPAGTITDVGTLVAVGSNAPASVNLVQAYNAQPDLPDLEPAAGWTPDRRPGPLDAAADVPKLVRDSAGVNKLKVRNVKPSPSPSPSASASPSPEASTGPGATPSASSAPGGGANPPGKLPVTGFQTALAGSFGAVLLAAGGALYVLGRRRRRIAFASSDELTG